MGVFVDVSGQRFNHLTAIKRVGSKTYPCGARLSFWECKCDCGNTAVVSLSSLRTGNTKSCGCMIEGAHEKIGRLNRTHGKSKTRLYQVWKQMKKRCNNPNDRVYKYYGGNGIHVCDEWSNSFTAFSDWAYANGYDENAKRGECTLDRINPFLDYGPSNCRWVTMKEQRGNRRADWSLNENPV